MYAVIIRNKVRPGMRGRYVEVSQRFAAEMRKLSGLHDFRVLVSDDDKDTVVDLLLWESREAAAADDGSVFLSFKPELKPLFESNVTETFEVL